MIMGGIYDSGLTQTKLFPSGGFSSGGTAEVNPDGGSVSGGYNFIGANATLLGQPFVWFLGLFALLGIAKWFGEHPDSPINPEHIHVGGYNWFVGGVIAVTFIAFGKMIVNRYPIPGVTQIFNAV